MNVFAFARGLMGLMGVKNDGRGITLANDAMTITLESERFLGANKRIAGYFPIATIVAGNNICATVPPGKIWILRAGGALVDTIAANTLTFQMRVIPPASPVSVVLSAQVAVAALNTGSTPLAFPNLILEAGSQLSIYAYNVVGGPGVGSITLLLEESESY